MINPMTPEGKRKRVLRFVERAGRMKTKSGGTGWGQFEESQKAKAYRLAYRRKGGEFDPNANVIDQFKPQSSTTPTQPEAVAQKGRVIKRKKKLSVYGKV